MTSVTTETRLALIHRVIVPDEEYPKEYAILLTDRSSIFVRQNSTRGNFWLRREMSYGTALVTDVLPKTLEDYEQTSLDDYFVRLTMRMQKEVFQVYDFELVYRQSPNSETMIKFYMVPLGAYFKPRRETQTRETILREYATDALEIFQKVLPAKIAA